MIERLQRMFDLAASNPKMGRARPDVGLGIRTVVVSSYVVFYRVVSGGIEIGRVMHGACNIEPDDIWPSFDPRDHEG